MDYRLGTEPLSAWKRMIREHKYRSKGREERERYEVTGIKGREEREREV